MSKRRKPPLNFSPHEWAPFCEAFTRIMTSVGELRLAAHRLYQDALGGRLQTALVEISPDGKETVTLLKPTAWRKWRVRTPTMSEESVHVGGVDEIAPESGFFFVRRDGLDTLYPAAMPTSAPATEPTTPSNPEGARRKPGRPPKHEWPVHVAREVIRGAKAGKRDPTAREMLEFCRHKWDWEPDIRQMQKLLGDLLS